MEIMTMITRQACFAYPQDPNEKERWRKVIPSDNLPDPKDTVVCAAHWPKNFEYKIVKGKRRPIRPPPMFKNIPPSMIPTPPKPRETMKAIPSKRNVLPDELSSFLERDNITFPALQNELINKYLQSFVLPVNVFMINNLLFIQSQKFFQGIPLFLVEIYNNLRFETFYFGVK